MNQALQNLRERLYRLEHDVRLIPFEREAARIESLGASNEYPPTVGKAKTYIKALETALHRATTEVPF